MDAPDMTDMEKNPVFWIIDDEWPDYSVEMRLLREAYPDCEIRISGIPFDDDLSAFGGEVDVVLAQISARIDAGVIAKLKKCRGIAVFGSGYNNVDIAAASAAGIPVTNVNGYCTEDIADYVLSAIFHFYKPIGQLAARAGDGKWGVEALSGQVHRLNKQVLLLIGFGYIGKVTAQRAMALGMRVLAHDPYAPDEVMRGAGVEPVTLDDGLAQADFVSIHARLTEQTTGMIHRGVFQKMKPTAVLINVARGPLVNEPDLIEAVRGGVIRGAVLDVVASEPIAADDPLLKVENILITPHISYASEESVMDLRERAVRNALAMCRGEQPMDLVKGP